MFSGIFPKKPDSAGEKALGLALGGGDDDDDGGSSNKNKRGGGGRSSGLFDPSGLERAAKAAKELDKSANAKESLRLIETQETTKQKEAEARRTEYEAHVKSLEIQRVQKVGGWVSEASSVAHSCLLLDETLEHIPTCTEPRLCRRARRRGGRWTRRRSTRSGAPSTGTSWSGSGTWTS